MVTAEIDPLYRVGSNKNGPAMRGIKPRCRTCKTPLKRVLHRVGNAHEPIDGYSYCKKCKRIVDLRGYVRQQKSQAAFRRVMNAHKEAANDRDANSDPNERTEEIRVN